MKQEEGILSWDLENEGDVITGHQRDRLMTSKGGVSLENQTKLEPEALARMVTCKPVGCWQWNLRTGDVRAVG